MITQGIRGNDRGAIAFEDDNWKKTNPKPPAGAADMVQDAIAPAIQGAGDVIQDVAGEMRQTTPVTRPTTTGGTAAGGSNAKNGYTAATLPSATSQADYINAMYNANEQRQRAALEAQYAANVGTLNQQAAAIPAQYDAAANQAAAQAAVNRAAFNEQAAATGMNTGAGSQAALAQNNALLGAVSEIRRNQADALNDVEAQRVALQQQYQAAIKEAIANNEAQRAAALYDEARRVDESLVSTAVNQATENYRAWQTMYG